MQLTIVHNHDQHTIAHNFELRVIKNQLLFYS